MIHVSAIHTITEGATKDIPFSFKAIKKSGELLEGNNCVCTSSNFERKTRNIKWIESEEIRTIHDIQFIEFNGKEVFL